jgi:hypothetical protein
MVHNGDAIGLIWPDGPFQRLHHGYSPPLLQISSAERRLAPGLWPSVSLFTVVIRRGSLGLKTEIPDRQPNQSDPAVKFQFLTHSEGESMKNACYENLVIVVIEIWLMAKYLDISEGLKSCRSIFLDPKRYKERIKLTIKVRISLVL